MAYRTLAERAQWRRDKVARLRAEQPEIIEALNKRLNRSPEARQREREAAKIRMRKTRANKKAEAERKRITAEKDREYRARTRPKPWQAARTQLILNLWASTLLTKQEISDKLAVPISSNSLTVMLYNWNKKGDPRPQQGREKRAQQVLDNVLNNE